MAFETSETDVTEEEAWKWYKLRGIILPGHGDTIARKLKEHNEND